MRDGNAGLRPAGAPRGGRRPGRRRRAGAALATLALATGAAFAPGCVAPQLAMLQGGLDSLRTAVDTITARDSITYRVLLDTRRQIAEQRDVLLSTRATAGSTTQQLFEQMERLETRLDETLRRFSEVAQRTTPPPAASGATDPNQLYDQSTSDLTQGRYALALQGFRDFLTRFPTSDLADNAQYGVGECFFAQAKFDSAAVEYARVGATWPQGDRVPAALYKLALSQDNLGQAEASRKTLQDLVKRYPQSGEAQLARDRLGSTRRR
jgi:tol-pal system protein YbgF